MITPSLVHHRAGKGVGIYTDPVLHAEHGVMVAFTQRHGGVSKPPYDSLNLAAHVGDVCTDVDENRSSLLNALNAGRVRERLVSAEQVHGTGVYRALEQDAGRGSLACAGRPPIPSTDALVTTVLDLPLLLCYADCVPVILVALRPLPAVAVVHAGWRGVLGRIVSAAVERLTDVSGCEASDILAYVGPHVCSSCYEVSDEIMSQFVHTFVTISQADQGLDLASAVSEDLESSGVEMTRQCHLGVCTAHETADQFSYRAEGLTGRHGALAMIGAGGR